MAALARALCRGYIPLALVLTAGLGCATQPRQGAGPESTVATEPNGAHAELERVRLALKYEPGARDRYRVSTKAWTAAEGAETAASHLPPEVSESSELVFTQEILGPLPDDPNAMAALVTIERAAYRRIGPPNLELNSENATDPNDPFARLVGQSYTIEIHPLGYVPGVFNLAPARTAVRGDSFAHAVVLDLLSPPAIFLRHGSFSLPGPDLGPLRVGGRWRGLQQFTLHAPMPYFGGLGTFRFEKIYRLERLEQRAGGTVAIVTFTGSPVRRRRLDGETISPPFLTASYRGGGEFNLDTGRLESYTEQLDIRLPRPGGKDRAVHATRFCLLERLDLN